MNASREKRDVYYRLAKELGIRARSAFKIHQINRTCNILEGVETILDLCAAPGGWSLLCREILRNRNVMTTRTTTHDDKIDQNIYSDIDIENTNSTYASKAKTQIIAVDYVAMGAMEGITTICGDITRPETTESILKQTNGSLIDIVLFDGAPDVTGQLDFDESLQHSLVLTGALLCLSVLRENGQYVAKLFRGTQTARTCSLLSLLFENVVMTKPQASRNSSLEGFVLCSGFRPNPVLREYPIDLLLSVGYEQTLKDVGYETSTAEAKYAFNQAKRAGPEYIPCIDVYDSDKTYSLTQKLEYIL